MKKLKTIPLCLVLSRDACVDRFLGFVCHREDILRHFIGLISDFKGTQDITKQRGIFAFVYRFLAPLNQPQCSATLIYGTTFHGSTKTEGGPL